MLRNSSKDWRSSGGVGLVSLGGGVAGGVWIGEVVSEVGALLLLLAGVLGGRMVGRLESLDSLECLGRLGVPGMWVTSA